MKLWMQMVLAAVLASAAIVADAGAQAPVAPDKKAIQEIVREYLLANPEVLEEAMKGLRAKREREQQAKTRAAIGEHRPALVAHSMSPVSGAPNGDVTMVEFFDYQCGYCKRSLKPVMDLLASDQRLRIVWEGLPDTRAGLALCRSRGDGGGEAGTVSRVP